MKTRIGRWTFLIGSATVALLMSACGGGGGGGHHHHSTGNGMAFTCASGTPYVGDQAGGGDIFGWCVDHANSSFSFTDISLSGSPTNGGFTPDATFADLLNLTAGASAGTAVEMPNTQVLVNPGNLITGPNATAGPVVLVSNQQGFCPAAGTNYNFATVPKSGWATGSPAYGTVSLAGANLSLTVKDLNGNAIGSENDTYSCDPTTSFLTFTQQSNGKMRTVVTSPKGLFIDTAGSGAAGLLQATSNVGNTIAVGTFLGVIYQPDGNNKVQTVGFKPGGCAAALCGFDPPTNSLNGMTLTPGNETSPGLFTNGTLVDANTDSPLVVVANTITVDGANKVVLYGIAFDSTANTAVSVLLLEQ